MMEGMVTKSTGSWYTVRDKDGQYIECRIRGKIRLKGMKVTNPIAVGDQVVYSMEHDDKGLIDEIKPRKNYLIRRSTRKTKFGHILASNIDQALVIATFTFPKTSLGFIDRFLIVAESFRIPQVLVFNKSDMWDEEVKEWVESIGDIYRNIGVKFLTTSAINGDGLEEFKQQLNSRKTLIAGHSGVGKSTMLNKISPGLIKQKIGEVSTFADKGTHTTTFAEMFEIDKDTFVIDTPGIKELGLIDIEEGEVSHFFPEMRDLFGKCRFHNCQHMSEPDCAVIKAVENGQISESRYYSYLSMKEDQDSFR